MRSLPTAELHTHRLVLTPLQVANAAEIVDVLADPELYAFTGANPPTLGSSSRDIALRSLVRAGTTRCGTTGFFGSSDLRTQADSCRQP
jgi:hypothetical protein